MSQPSDCDSQSSERQYDYSNRFACHAGWRTLVLSVVERKTSGELAEMLRLLSEIKIVADWKSDWGTFIKKIGQAYEEGLDDESVTERFMGQRVRWHGDVIGLTECKTGLRISMVPVKIARSDGRWAIVDFVCLCFSDSCNCDWRSISPGKHIQFSTELANCFIPAPSIRWCSVSGVKGVVTLSTQNSEILEVLPDE